MKKSTSHNVKAKEKEVRQQLVSEMAEDAWAEVLVEVNKLRNRLHDSVPAHVFQEKHTTGALWWRKTYYTYSRYFEGSVHQLNTYTARTIKGLEK